MIRKKRRKKPQTFQQKYPCTSTFEWYNANPKGKITGDCVFRAFALALDQDYNQTVMEMAELMCETGYALNDKYGEEEYLKRKGWIKQKQPRKPDNTKYTGEEFCKVQQKWLHDESLHGAEYKDGIIISPKILCHIGGHHMVAIVNGKVHDIWDSTGGCIGNYWTKE